MVVIQCLDSFPFQFCSVTSCHVNCRWCCASYQLWSTGSQLYIHPVCHSDGLFVSTRCGIHSALRRTPSAVPTHACTPVVLSLPPLAFHGHVVHVWTLLDPSPRSGDPWQVLPESLSAVRWAHAAVVLAGVLPGEEPLGIVHLYTL